MGTLDGQTIGFIGLGLMGRPMCRNLKTAGADLVIYNRGRLPLDELAAEGMSPAETPREVAGRAPIIILMVSDTPAVEAVLGGARGAIAGLAPGALVIDMGTTAVTATRAFASRVADSGGAYLDAPVSGGQVGAEAASLSIMAGGEAAAFARAEPIFRVLGGRVTHVGDTGAGQVAKTANQIIVALTIGAVAEALTLAKRAGVDPARVRDALDGGFASSRILELHGRRMVEDDFTPGGRAKTQLKDMVQAMELAGELGLALPATELSRDLYARMVEAGWGDLDHSGLIKVIEEA
jgi:3-hydroxyisobutyrate dehydrogenase-like beta-hydroxyacid dehydrogenase